MIILRQQMRSKPERTDDAATATFSDALAAPPDRKFYDASRDPALV